MVFYPKTKKFLIPNLIRSCTLFLKYTTESPGNQNLEDPKKVISVKKILLV